MSSGKWRPFCLGLNVLSQHFPADGLALPGIMASAATVLNKFDHRTYESGI